MVVQRVSRGSVSIDGIIINSISKGYVVLLGIKNGDTEEDVEFLSDKCLNMRIFEDKEGKMNLSISEVGGEILVISQFTLYGDVQKGRRPSFTDSAPSEIAEKLYNKFIDKLKLSGLNVVTGVFGSNMLVEILNDGPVTIIVDSKNN
jgi:D-tyrosyl-tRNA(Tyr) deacylase